MSHDPIPTGILYGPVTSRRLGMSLGVNLSPPGSKLCAFNCNYCELGWTFDLADESAVSKYAWPEAEAVGAALEARLKEKVDALTISGNGEPTLHPDFYRVVTAIVEARDKVAPQLKIHVLTNGANLDRPQVISGLNLVEGRHVKLDAGSEAMFMEMNNPTADIGIWDIMKNAAKLTDFTIQAMFTRGRRDNTTEAEVDKWVEAVKRMTPREVHVMTIERTAADAAVRAVDQPTLEAIAKKCGERVGVPCRVFS